MSIDIERRVEDIAKGLANVVRSAACSTTVEWGRSISLPYALLSREVFERLEVTSCPYRLAESSELVRIDFNFNGVVSAKNDLAHLLRLEIEPFVIGVGQVRVLDTTEGVVVLRADAYADGRLQAAAAIRSVKAAQPG